jgi:hypothetical protein
MAQADDNDTINVPPRELSLRIQLRKAGLRLEHADFNYTIVYKNQTLISGNGRGEGLSLDEIVAFVERTLIR